MSEYIVNLALLFIYILLTPRSDAALTVPSPCDSVSVCGRVTPRRRRCAGVHYGVGARGVYIGMSVFGVTLRRSTSTRRTHNSNS